MSIEFIHRLVELLLSNPELIEKIKELLIDHEPSVEEILLAKENRRDPVG